VAQNIKVVNLSVNGSVRTSYLTSPIAAAVETLMMSGVTVVVAAGNRGTVSTAVQYAPANDPFVISVGALDSNETITGADDSLAPFSSRGLTLNGHAKPDVVAPGRKIVAQSAGPLSTLALEFPDRIVDGNYIRLSGTSMAAPVVTGICALLLQRYPSLNPHQVKWLVTNTARAYPGQVGAAGLIDPAAMFARAALGSVPLANQTYQFNNTVADAMDDNVNNTASYWDASYWDASYWDASYWDASYWDASYWDAAAFEAAEFETYPD
jgi:serine protease AprX